MGNKLDEELARAAAVDDPSPSATGDDAGRTSVPPVIAAAVTPPKNTTRNLGLLATLLVMVGALTALFLVGFKDAAVYSTPVDELVRTKIGRKVRVEGELVPGSLVKRDQPCEYRFSIHGEKEQLPVRYAQCVIPDTFRDVPSGGVMVTVEGAMTQGGQFEASLVMAKCASKYDPATHEMKTGPAAAADMPIN